MADKEPEKNETPEEKPTEESAKEDAEANSAKQEDEPGEKPSKKNADKNKTEEPQPKSGKKKIMIIAAAVLVVLIGGGATAFFMLSGSSSKQEAKVNLPPPPGPMTTYSFPKVISDLKTGLCRANYLSMLFMVEVGQNYTKALQKNQVKLLESVQLHLRSLERQDLVGKVGSDRLRADIISIINAKIKPGKVEGVIFKEFILQ